MTRVVGSCTSEYKGTSGIVLIYPSFTVFNYRTTKATKAIQAAVISAFMLASPALAKSAKKEDTKPLFKKKGEKVTLVVAGSYRKFITEVCEAKKQLEKAGAVVLEPACTEVVNPGDHFIIMKGDVKGELTEAEKTRVALRFLRHSGEADIFYIMNKDGYVGYNTVYEAGFAKGKRKKVFCAEPLADEGLVTTKFCKVVPLPEIIKEIKAVYAAEKKAK